MRILGFYFDIMRALEEIEELHLNYITTRAAQLGTEVAELWQMLFNQARAEIAGSSGGVP